MTRIPWIMRSAGLEHGDRRGGDTEGLHISNLVLNYFDLRLAMLKSVPDNSLGGLYENLRPVIVIFLVAEDLFPSRPRDFDVSFSLQQEDSGSPVMAELKGQMRLIFVEILKAFRLWQERQLSPDDVSLGAWLAFLAAPNSQIVKEACMSMPELKDAKDALEDLSAKDEAREIARLREKARLDMDSIVANAKKEGRAEGEAKGRAEQSLLLLKKLLSDAATSALSNAHLAELTGITEAEVAKARTTRSK